MNKRGEMTLVLDYLQMRWRHIYVASLVGPDDELSAIEFSVVSLHGVLMTHKGRAAEIVAFCIAILERREHDLLGLNDAML